MNRKEKSRKKKNVEKSLKDGAYTKGTYGMGNPLRRFPSPPLLLLPLLPPLIDSMWTVCKFQN